MFKKTLKHIKILFLIIIVLVCLPHSILPLKNPEINKSDLDYYIMLNNGESRLIEFKDDEEALKIKLEQLLIINKSRKKFKGPEVKLDILASRVANKMSREAAENNFVGHWNLKGEKPYHRYAFAGGYDHVSENAFGEWTNGKYIKSPVTVTAMMKKGHNSFMSERAPADGHKKNIIDKSHNYVGIGFFLMENQFRYYEEFVDRYFNFEDIPAQLNVNEKGSITIKTNGKNFPYFLVIYRENFPVPLKLEQLGKKGSYEDYSNEEYMNIPAWDIYRYKSGDKYIIPLKFNREGLFYIQIFADRNEITSPRKLDTKGKTIGSGIVIKVVNEI
jgi:hypothetical protein